MGVASIDAVVSFPLVRLLLVLVLFDVVLLSLASAEYRGGVAAGCLGEEKCLRTRLFSLG